MSLAIVSGCSSPVRCPSPTLSPNHRTWAPDVLAARLEELQLLGYRVPNKWSNVLHDATPLTKKGSCNEPEESVYPFDDEAIADLKCEASPIMNRAAIATTNEVDALSIDNEAVLITSVTNGAVFTYKRDEATADDDADYSLRSAALSTLTGFAGLPVYFILHKLLKVGVRV